MKVYSHWVPDETILDIIPNFVRKHFYVPTKIVLKDSGTKDHVLPWVAMDIWFTSKFFKNQKIIAVRVKSIEYPNLDEPWFAKYFEIEAWEQASNNNVRKITEIGVKRINRKFVQDAISSLKDEIFKYYRENKEVDFSRYFEVYCDAILHAFIYRNGYREAAETEELKNHLKELEDSK